MKKFLKRSAAVVSGLIISFFLWGCATSAIIPTTTNPALEQVTGVKAPFIRILGIKVTLQGINDGIEALADFEHDITYPMGKEWEKRGRERSKNIATTVLGLISAVGLAGTGALPLALKAVPKGYKKEEEE